MLPVWLATWVRKFLVIHHCDESRPRSEWWCRYYRNNFSGRWPLYIVDRPWLRKSFHGRWLRDAYKIYLTISVSNNKCIITSQRDLLTGCMWKYIFASGRMEGTWAPCFFLAPFFCSPSFSPPFSLSLLTRSCHNSFDLSHSLSSCLHPSLLFSGDRGGGGNDEDYDDDRPRGWWIHHRHHREGRIYCPRPR